MHKLIEKSLNEDDKQYILNIANKLWNSPKDHNWYNRLYKDKTPLILYHCELCNLMYLETPGAENYIMITNEIKSIDNMYSCEKLIIKNIIE